MQNNPLRLAIIVGSTREGRFGEVVGRWFRRQAMLREDLEVDYIDLADVHLPARMESASPDVQLYLAHIDSADAFVVVTPEYNHGYPAALKHAIDVARDEWMTKPVAFVSYGGMAGGLRAVEQLRQVFAELHAVTVRDTVSFHFAQRQFDEAGQPLDGEGTAAAASKMLSQIVWWAAALRRAREESPFAA